MAAFKLTVVTPNRIAYDGEATFLLVRTTMGDVGIMAHHTNYAAPLVIGTMKVEFTSKDDAKLAAIGGGFVQVQNNEVTVVTSSCEWQEEIDLPRAQRAAERARARIEQSSSKKEVQAAEIKLKLALNRIHVADHKL
mgnify:FL=1